MFLDKYRKVWIVILRARLLRQALVFCVFITCAHYEQMNDFLSIFERFLLKLFACTQQYIGDA